MSLHADVTARYELADIIDAIRATRTAITATHEWISDRVDAYRAHRTATPGTPDAAQPAVEAAGTSPADTQTSTDTTTTPNKDGAAMDPEQRRRTDEAAEQEARELAEQDVAADGRLDGNDDPYQAGTSADPDPDPDLDLEA